MSVKKERAGGAHASRRACKLPCSMGERSLSHDIQGGCMCGAVRYSATANPANTMICHCQSCRRSAASPVVAWVTFAKAEFQFTRGTPVKYDSSPKVQRRFCGTCGSPLTYEH